MPLAPPPAVNQDINSRQFRDWFYSIYALLGQPGQTLGTMAYEDSNSVAITGGALGGVGISGSTINSTPIGQATAAAGKFTDLQATGTISGTGINNLFASPPPIGSTTSNTGKFTTLEATASLKTDTLTGYLYGNGSGSDVTASTTIPSGSISGLGTMATQNANSVAITGGTITGVNLSGSSIPYSDVTGTPTGLSVTITTAKLTTLGANGSMTFTNGILTAQTQAT